VALEEGKTSKELIDGLVGANIGSTVTIKEKDVIHSIKVKEIKEKCLPTLDDNFAHSINRCKNLAELKELIYNDLVRHNEAKVKLDMKNQLLQQLLKDNKFSCPPSLVEEELEQLVNEAKLRQNLQRREEKKVFSQEEAMKEELKTEAENRVRLSFILDEIARQENICVSPKEIEDSLKSIEEKTAQKINSPEKDLIDRLRFQLREGKVIDFLLKEAKITEAN
jgi:trigger factor